MRFLLQTVWPRLTAMTSHVYWRQSVITLSNDPELPKWMNIECPHHIYPTDGSTCPNVVFYMHSSSKHLIARIVKLTWPDEAPCFQWTTFNNDVLYWGRKTWAPKFKLQCGIHFTKIYRTKRMKQNFISTQFSKESFTFWFLTSIFYPSSYSRVCNIKRHCYFIFLEILQVHSDILSVNQKAKIKE